MDSNIETEAFRNAKRLKELRVEHRRLDDEIDLLSQDPSADQFQLLRMKRRRLVLKDMINQLESDQIPDLNA